ncbi:hypothetical protein B0T24DRAFT_667382 [Lasiosphaeria ovina]|uniref:F-box domain-containing protein n=1 Tax=Lasiosphaeria ovina TaxID=92902 RepID=A0AAE0N8V2_9PEZI|nr:hypothetical protein B0T24DRAFT_667382 [Lasiosphaeria ovina]
MAALGDIRLPEILHLTCEKLDLANVRKLRLVSKAFNEIALHHAYPKLVIYKTPRDISFLQAIINHPGAAASVKSLVYLPDTIDPDLSWDEFLELFVQREKLKKRGVDDVGNLQDHPQLWVEWPLETDAAFLREVYGPVLREMYNERMELALAQLDIEDLPVIQAAMTKLPSLSSLEISRDQDPDFATRNDLALLGGDRQTLSDPYDARRPWIVVRSGRRFNVAPAILTSAGFCYADGGKHKGVSENLKNISLGWLDWRSFDEDEHHYPASSEAEGNASEMGAGATGGANIQPSIHRCLFNVTCANLARVDLYITTGAKFDNGTEIGGHGSELALPGVQINRDEMHWGIEVEACRKSMAKGGLRRFLKSLPQLKRISVAFDYFGSQGGNGVVGVTEFVPECYPAALADIVEPGHVWPGLDEFRIDCVECDYADLMGFLAAHKSTLRSLSMAMLCLNGVSLLALAPVIRRELRLERASVRGDFFCSYTDERTGMELDEEWSIWDIESYPGRSLIYSGPAMDPDQHTQGLLWTAGAAKQWEEQRARLSLTRFLSAHKATLCTLTLRALRFDGVSWATLAPFILNELSLRRAIIEGSFYCFCNNPGTGLPVIEKCSDVDILQPPTRPPTNRFFWTQAALAEYEAHLLSHAYEEEAERRREAGDHE